MTNKEVIDKLVIYFLQQDPQLVARMCANLFVDVNRFFNIDQLSVGERDHLRLRTQANIDVINDYLVTGYMDDLKIFNMPYSDLNP